MSAPRYSLRKLARGDMAAAARIHRTAFEAALPWLPELHTPEEDFGFWSGPLFETTQIWGAEIDDRLIGVIAFDEKWVEQLYIEPPFQAMGAGSALLAVAQAQSSALQLWTFERNNKARRFYEKHGFLAIERTDGSGNEEKEPDILYQWQRNAG